MAADDVTATGLCGEPVHVVLRSGLPAIQARPADRPGDRLVRLSEIREIGGV
jgi:hypothetical protein